MSGRSLAALLVCGVLLAPAGAQERPRAEPKRYDLRARYLPRVGDEVVVHEVQRQRRRFRIEREGEVLENHKGSMTLETRYEQRVEKVELDPAVCAGMAASEDARVQAQRLITEATNDALEKCQNRIREMVELEVKRLGLEDLIPAGGGGLGPIGKLLG